MSGAPDDPQKPWETVRRGLLLLVSLLLLMSLWPLPLLLLQLLLLRGGRLRRARCLSL